MLAIKKGKYDLQSEEWQYISRTAKDLISKMIAPKMKRISVEEVLEHTWFKDSSKKNLKMELSM